MNPLVLFPIEHHLALPPRTVAFCRFEHAKPISLGSVAIVLPKRLRTSLPATGALRPRTRPESSQAYSPRSVRTLASVAPQNRRFTLRTCQKGPQTCSP